MNALALLSSPAIIESPLPPKAVIASAVLKKCKYVVCRADFQKAADIMGRKLSDETVAYLEALNCCKFSDCSVEIHDWLIALGEAILAD